MSKQDYLELNGVVIDKLPKAQFTVRLENDCIITCHLSGKMRQNRIMIITGDRVTVEVSSYDLTKGRITWRFK